MLKKSKSSIVSINSSENESLKSKKWFEIPIKTKSKHEIAALKIKGNFEVISKEEDKINILDVKHQPEENIKTEVPSNRKKNRVVRRAADKVWNRKQRITEIGKKSSRCGNAMNEKKYFKIGAKMRKPRID